jgi:hypothetical protein
VWLLDRAVPRDSGPRRGAELVSPLWATTLLSRDARTLMTTLFTGVPLVWFTERPSETKLVVAANGHPAGDDHRRGDWCMWCDHSGCNY